MRFGPGIARPSSGGRLSCWRRKTPRRVLLSSRPAGIDDLARIEALCRQGGLELLTGRGGPQFLRSRSGPGSGALVVRAEDLASSDCHVVLGSIDEVPVGLGVGKVVHWGRPDLGEHAEPPVLAEDRDREVGLIQDLYVEPEARSVGLGEMLLNDLLAFFSARGIVEVDASALPGDRATKNFFESAGFKARLLIMHRHTGGGEVS